MAQAEIKTGKRRIIELLSSPLARRVDEAGREVGMADEPYAPEFRAADVQALAPGVFTMPSPPQLVAKQTDPRIASITDRDDYLRPLLISPAEYPKPGLSRFVLVKPYSSRATYDTEDANEEPLALFDWPNRFQLDKWRLGGGLGFSGSDLPFLRGLVRAGHPIPELLADLNAAHWVVAPRLLDLLNEFGIDAGHYVTAKPLWSEDSDPRFVDYLLFDAVRLIDSYDYDRSEFHVSDDSRFSDGGHRLSFYLTHRRAFREDIAPDVHLFRDLYLRQETVISRELWRFLRERKVRGLFAMDPAWGDAFHHDPVFKHLERDPGAGVTSAQ